MSNVLGLRLFGPLASWGEVAVGEVRASASRPTRSALLGLVAAALGIDRQDDETHERLRDGLYFATRSDRPGLALIDYHTINWRKPRRKERILTRADELRVHRTELGTIQSARHYRCDALTTVLITASRRSDITLERLGDALEKPAFPLFLGRKACVLALPLSPRILDADTLVEGFVRYDDAAPLPERLARRFTAPGPLVVSWDFHHPVASGIDPAATRIEQRRDQPRSRRRWRFESRTESVASIAQTAFAKGDLDAPQPAIHH